jgi:hypothetical protein
LLEEKILMRRFPILKTATTLLGLITLAGAAPLAAPLLLLPAHAQLHPPEIRSVYPLGGSLGATTRVTIGGVSFRNAAQVLFDKPGITATIVAPDAAKLPAPTLESDGNPPVVVDFAVGKEAAPGLYYFRIVSPAGVSSAGKWVVGRNLPTIEEKEPNNDLTQAQSVSLPISVNGHIGEVGDQDTFGFDLEAGKTFVGEVTAALADSPLDSLLTLRDAEGHELASNDDYNGPDSLLVFEVKKSGRYFLTLSSSVGSGGADQAYRLSMGYLPLLQAVYPISIPRGKTTEVTLIGINLPRTLSVTPSADVGMSLMPLFVTTPLASNARPVALSSLPTIQEREPNDDRLHATPMPAPGIANGQFYHVGNGTGVDVDFYRFHADAGRRFLIDAQCQAIGSRGDPILTLYDSDGKQIDENDDSIGRDSHLDHTFDRAGDYFLRVKDVPGRSAPDLVYRLIIQEPPPPGFALSTETRARMIGRGDSVPFEVAVERDRWEGPVTLSLADLPSGVTATTTTVPAGVARGLLVLTADARAPMGVFPLHIVGAAQVNGKTVQHTLTRAGDWIWKGGPRATQPAPAGALFFAVGSPAEIAPKTDAKELTLARGQGVKFKVSVEKRVPYGKPIPFAILGLPDGVTLTNATLPADKTEIELELKATDMARLGTFPIAIDSLATNSPTVQIDRVTAPIALTVTAPAKK